MLSSLWTSQQNPEHETVTLFIPTSKEGYHVHESWKSHVCAILWCQRPTTVEMATYSHDCHCCHVLCHIAETETEYEEPKRSPRGMLSQGFILLHDNARPHVAVSCQKLLRKFRWEFLKYPPYSQDLLTCDYYIFSSLNKSLNVRRFACDNEVQVAVDNCPTFTECIHRLVDHWDSLKFD